jgi:hypothetical protein
MSIYSRRFWLPPRAGKDKHAKADAFGLPALGSKGTFHFGYLPGPAFFDADISATKHFKVTERSNVSFRFSAFNFLNHPNVSFSGLDPSAYTLNYTQTVTGGNVNEATVSAINDNTGFGTAKFKTGRRIMELSLRYEF